jgi:hypothetical protein
MTPLAAVAIVSTSGAVHDSPQRFSKPARRRTMLVDARHLRPVLIPKLRPGKDQPCFEHHSMSYGVLYGKAHKGNEKMEAWRRGV